MKTLLEYIFICFTISIVAGYFASVGYYSQYNFSITSFLSIEDLTIVFARWIWIGFLFAFMIYMIIEDIDLNKKSWWTKSYKKFGLTNFGIIIIISIIFLITFSFLYKKIREFSFLLFLSSILFFVAFGMLQSMKEIIISNKEIANYSFNDWIKIVFFTFLFIIIFPFGVGIFNATFILKENIEFIIDDNKKISTKIRAI